MAQPSLKLMEITLLLMFGRLWVQFSGLGGCRGLGEERKQKQEHFR